MRPGHRGVDRSSLRSQGSSHIKRTPEKLRDCCRKLVAFMCTQVGVGGLVVGYAVVGAFGFMAIESVGKRPEIRFVKSLHRNCCHELWRVTTTENIFNRTLWQKGTVRALKVLQEGIAVEVKKGYDGRTAEETWSFPTALMFSLSIFTMIGYGNMVPRTSLGKVTTVVYACFGIPLYVLYFMSMGKVLAQTFRWIYIKVYLCSMVDRYGPDGSLQPEPRIIVPSTACLWVMACYVAAGAVMFTKWENWDYLDSTYFCVTSLCKIGIGDFVPGVNIQDARSGDQTKLVINFIYILLGMGLMAMCYNLMCEVVRVKMREFKQDIGICFEYIRLIAVDYYNRTPVEEEQP